MSEEDDMHPTGAIETIPALGQLRADLLTAVERDRSKAARRRKVVMAAVIAVIAIGAVGSAIAAATGAFSPAPPDVQRKFADLGPEVDESKAIAIGTIDEHPAYAAPTENGGFCLYFASNPSRSGPNGAVCTTKDPGPTEIALNVQPATTAASCSAGLEPTRQRVSRSSFPVGPGWLPRRYDRIASSWSSCPRALCRR